MNEPRIAILGASRGLGAHTCKQLLKQFPHASVMGVGRKAEALHSMKEEWGGRFIPFVFDLSQGESFHLLAAELAKFSPDHIIYMAGGGPFGPFEKRSFQSHQWAWKVTFEAAAWTCHWALNQSVPPQVILIGSSVCEERPDAGASSYAAAKHALKGLYTSLREERPLWDLRLFSPGYMDTDLLPPGAEVRNKGVWSPEAVAQELVSWMFNDRLLGSWRQFSLHPE